MDEMVLASLLLAGVSLVSQLVVKMEEEGKLVHSQELSFQWRWTVLVLGRVYQ